MTFTGGSHLGPYEILAPIGAGGMGEVYKARDSRLGRDVAIKVCSEQFTERFEREARAIAALNHPNICHLYDVGPNYLVMELVDGAPLKGRLPLEKVLDYARQILDALDAAHSKDITHRDLKPANILVARSGIKLLDFGLAKQSGPLSQTDVTQALTQQGAIVGTLNYMSPEQLQSQEADARSDIFAFGLVLYEMLTGKPAYTGTSAASVIAAILERPSPSVTSVAPPGMDRLLARCLEKDPEQRWQSARDVRSALDLAITSQPPARTRSTRFGWIAAGPVALAAVLLAWDLWRAAPLYDRPLAFHVIPPPGTDFFTANGGGSISPDGRTIAMVAYASGAPARLWVRPLDSVITRELAGTEGAQYPFWSPDSRSIAFFSGGKLRRIDLSGGSPATITDAPSARGGTWNEEGTIVFAPNSTGGLLRVPATGGATAPFTSLDKAKHETTHRWPQFLPGGRRFIYYVQALDGRTEIFVAPTGHSEQRKFLVEANGGGIYVRPKSHYPGYLVWLRQGVLSAQPLDAERGTLTGEPLAVPGAEMVGVVMGANQYSGLSASNDGIVLASHGTDRQVLTWMSRDGRTLGSVGGIDHYAGVNLSPDGTRALVSIGEPSGNRDVWVLDLARGVRTRLTAEHQQFGAIWSADGRRVAYFLANGGPIIQRDASGAGPPNVLHESDLAAADDFSPDGRYLMYDQTESEGARSIWTLPLSPSGAASGQPSIYLKTPFSSASARFSPDLKWVAHSSNESGQQEIYVESFPTPAVRTQVSNSGGYYPRWRRDGKELFYRAPDGRVMVATVRYTTGGLEFSPPSALFRIPESFGGRFYPYDVSADGQRILALMPDNSQLSPLTVLVNWQAGLKK